MTLPLVSIVLPTYNGARYLAESIESCMAQTHTNWELIIVDDASTDETPEIIARYCEMDDRIKVMRQKTNRRLPASLNTGFSAAQGEYLTWTSDDNRYRPAAILEMLLFLQAHPQVGLVYADSSSIGDNGEFLRINKVGKPHELSHGNCVGACFLYKAEVHQKIGGYSEKLFLVEDWDFWLRASNHFQLVPMHKDLYFYRIHSNSLSATKRVEIAKAIERLLLLHLPNLRWVSQIEKSRSYWSLTTIFYRIGDMTSARRYLLKALAQSPIRTLRYLLRHQKLMFYKILLEPILRKN